MAKPGSPQAREQAGEMRELAQMSRIAKSIEGGVLPESYALRMRVQGEQQLGTRCSGCGGRIGVGFKFTSLEPTLVEGKPTLDVATLAACNGEHPACPNCGLGRFDYAPARAEHPDRAAVEGEGWPSCQRCGNEQPPVACDFAMKAREGATFMEMVEYVWLDDFDGDEAADEAVAEDQQAEAA